MVNSDYIRLFTAGMEYHPLKGVRSTPNVKVFSHTTPPHYKLSPEPIEVIQSWNLNFCLGNAIKYIVRAGHKNGETKVSDLNKAIDYIRFELEKRNDS